MTQTERARTQAGGRAKALDAAIDQLVMSAPSESHPPRRRLVHRILACVGEADAASVIAWTRELARLFSADVTLLHVTRPPAPAAIGPASGHLGFGVSASLPAADPEALRLEARRRLESARSEVASEASEVTLLHREGHPGDEIVRAARELASDLIVIGHHEGGALDRLLVGSTADHVKDHTHADVLIARGMPSAGPILAGVDGSAASREAAQIGDEVAQRWSTTLHLLYVVPPRWHTTVDEAIAEELRASATAQGTTTPLAGVERELRAGDARDTLRLAARGIRASLIAVGSRGTSGLRSLMPGSVSNALAHESPASVLLVRGEPLR